MDADRFDAIAKAVIAETSRRRTLAALLGAALGTLALARSDPVTAAKSGKCKPKCGECETCKKGDCEKKNGKKRCKKGKCRPKPDGTACTAFPGGLCRNGNCVNLKTDEANCGSLGNACGPTQVCQSGICFPTGSCPASTTSPCPIATGCGPECFCGRSSEGNVACVQDASFCDTPSPCTTSGECPAGEACFDVSNCCGASLPPGTGNCLSPCAAPAT